MIPVYRPIRAGKEDEYLLAALREIFSATGDPSKPIRVFEERFADYVGVRHAVAVSSGTAALEAALYAAGVGRDDEVIVPSFTIISCAIAVLRLAATPVFVDVDPDTWCIDAGQVEQAITERTKAVMPVHMMGHPAHCMRLEDLCVVRDLNMIEDACQAHGASVVGGNTPTWGGRVYNGEFKCGNWGAVAAFSFYPNKLITTCEGGMVTTDDDDIAGRARSYRNLSFGLGDDRFVHTALSFNFRMSALAAALGCAQLEAIHEFLDIKRSIAHRYRTNLQDCDGLRLQTVQPWARPSYWMNGVILDNMRNTDMILRLSEKGIESRPFFTGLHDQPALAGKYKVLTKEPTIVSGICARNEWLGFPVTEELQQHGLYLPSGPGLLDDEIDYVCETVRTLIMEP